MRLVTPDPTAPDTELVDLMEAAQRLGITYDGVRRRIRRGRLHGIKRDGRWVVAMPAHTGPAPDITGHTPDESGETAGPPPDTAKLLHDLLRQVEGERDHLRQVVSAQQQTIDRLTVLLKQAQDQPLLSPGLPRTEPQPPAQRPHRRVERPVASRKGRSWWQRLFATNRR
jgi:hypothetical protein